MRYKSLFELLSRNVKSHPDKKALFHKSGGAYLPITYGEFHEKVLHLAAGLLSSFSLSPGDKVAIFSNNCPEWVFADFAAISLSLVTVPVYPTLTAKEAAYLLNDSGARLIFVQTSDHLARIGEIAADCPSLEWIISFDPAADRSTDKVRLLADVMAAGSKADASVRDEVQRRIAGLSRDVLASIVYTSGTTGNPKGVMLSHGNFLTNVEDVLKVLPIHDNEVVLSFLPLSHVFERTAGYYTLLAAGGAIYYAESIDTVAQNMREARPTAVVSVPRLYEKMQARILDGLHGIKKPLFFWAMKVGQAYKTAQKKGNVPFWLSLRFKLADKLVYGKVKARTGGRLRFFVSGGAPLGRELGRFFENLDLLIIEGYGLTEAAPIIACNRLDRYKMGTVGLPLPSMEAKIAADGELIVRGGNVMKGYYGLEKETKEAIDEDGWLHTGDIAEIDSEGFIRIVDRKKELIVLSNGKKVPPQMVEGILLQSKFISQVLVLGEKHSYLTALIVPNLTRLKKVAMRYKWSFKNESDLIYLPEVKAFYEDVLKQRQKDLANFERVKVFSLIEHEFSIEGGELTPTLKPRRSIIYQKYKDVIEAMYDAQDDRKGSSHE